MAVNLASNDLMARLVSAPYVMSQVSEVDGLWTTAVSFFFGRKEAISRKNIISDEQDFYVRVELTW